MRKYTVVLLITIIVSCFVFVDSIHFGVSQVPDPVNGIIASDTTWTKSSSPYTLSGPLLVNNGATLTIQPGVTVNLNNYYITVNGTLDARGSGNDKIVFYGGQITFSQYSSGWNQGTQSGSIIEYAVLGIDSNSAGLISILDSSPMIRSSSIRFGIVISGGSPIIFNNNITPSTYYKMYGQPPQAYGPLQNAIYGIIIDTFNGLVNNTAIISDNVIAGNYEGACIVMKAGNPTIQRNTICDSAGIGIDMSTIETPSNPVIQNNTISSCNQAVVVGPDLSSGEFALSFIGNNLQNNSKYNLYLGATSNLDAAHNWWGTTDQQAIDQSIYDFKNDFNLGTVNFTPFLTSLNPEAIPNPNAPIPTPNTSQTSSSTPTAVSSQNPTPTTSGANNPIQLSIDWMQVALFSVLTLIAFLLVVVIVLLYKRNKLQSKFLEMQKPRSS